MSDKRIHIPVMVNEVLEGLRVRPGGVYVDATLGAGGHAEAILKNSAPNGRLIAIDADGTLLQQTMQQLEKQFGIRITAHCIFFDQLESVVVESVDGVLFDLGISSWHFEQSGRGFSFQQDEPLDMRLSEQNKTTAAGIINHADREELERLFREEGEEQFAGRIAAAIVGARPLYSTRELADLVVEAVPRKGRLHPATRVFQALRIAVNDELGRLRRVLPQAMQVLVPGGRCVVIAFHSLEDRIVKRQFRQWQMEEMGEVLTKKPLRPTSEEVQSNPRSRSAKLRIFEKTMKGER